MRLPKMIEDRLPSRTRLRIHERRHARAVKRARKEGLFKEFADHIQSDDHELSEWRQGLADEALVKRGLRVDIHLSDHPEPPRDDEKDLGHHRVGHFGDILLQPTSRALLRQLLAEREPAARKELRETVALFFQAGTMMIGLLGAATGFLAVWQKMP